MRFVFAPWRLEYVTSKKGEGQCVFCAAFEQDPSPDNLVLYRDERLAVMLNRYPYTNGHLMVIPRPHVDTLTGLDPEGRAAAAESPHVLRSAAETRLPGAGSKRGIEPGPSRRRGASRTISTGTFCPAGPETPTSSRSAGIPGFFQKTWPRPLPGFVPSFQAGSNSIRMPRGGIRSRRGSEMPHSPGSSLSRFSINPTRTTWFFPPLLRQV